MPLLGVPHSTPSTPFPKLSPLVILSSARTCDIFLVFGPTAVEMALCQASLDRSDLCVGVDTSLKYRTVSILGFIAFPVNILWQIRAEIQGSVVM